MMSKEFSVSDKDLEQVSGGAARSVMHRNDDTCPNCNGTGTDDSGKRPVPCAKCGGTGRKTV